MSFKTSVWSLKEIAQPAIGSFTATLLFYALRSGEQLLINPLAGLIISGLLLIVYYNGLSMLDKKMNFLVDAIISFLIASSMAIIFGVTTLEQLLTTNPFGTVVIVGWWMAFPAAVLFDKYDFTNPLKRNYVRR